MVAARFLTRYLSCDMQRLRWRPLRSVMYFTARHVYVKEFGGGERFRFVARSPLRKHEMVWWR